MIPLGWTPKTMPIKKYEIMGDEIIWYLETGSGLMPHKKEVVLSWDEEYLRKKNTIYTMRERRRAHCSLYPYMAKAMAKVNYERASSKSL